MEALQCKKWTVANTFLLLFGDSNRLWSVVPVTRILIKTISVEFVFNRVDRETFRDLNVHVSSLQNFEFQNILDMGLDSQLYV